MKFVKSLLCEIVKITFISILLVVTMSFSDEIKQWELSDERVNYLLAGDVCAEIGLVERISGFKRMGVSNWTKVEQEFRWPIITTKTGEFNISILINTPQKGITLILSSNTHSVEVKSLEKGWHRINTKLQLAGGKGEIKLQLKNSFSENQKAEIIGIEVITTTHFPVSYNETIID